MSEDFDFSARYKIEGWASGIAWRAVSYEIELREYIVDDEDEELYWTDYEEVENRDRVVCIMVGDDRKFTFDVDELIKIDEDEYCPECGQIGCKAYG